MVLDLQRYTRDFLRQPSERCKSETLVVPGSGNAGLNATVGDYTATADRQTSMYSKVANRASAASAVRLRLEFDMVYQFTFERFEKLSATALSQQLPFRLLRQPGHTLHHG